MCNLYLQGPASLLLCLFWQKEWWRCVGCGESRCGGGTVLTLNYDAIVVKLVLLFRTCRLTGTLWSCFYILDLTHLPWNAVLYCIFFNYQVNFEIFYVGLTAVQCFTSWCTHGFGNTSHCIHSQAIQYILALVVWN